jgi:hypothetical protein
VEESEKRIYNTYLAVSRSAIDKPFKIRKKFDNFEQHKDYPAVVKLGRFFNKHKHININSFFEAPFFVYNEDYFDLNFYCSYKAISTYTRYHENYLLDNPSSKVCMGKIKESIEFIHLYCKGQNISMSSYISHVEPGSAYNSFLTHLKDRKINVYILFAFRNFDIIIRSLDINIKQTFSPCLVRIKYLRTKLYTANQTKKNVDMFKAYLEKTK